jgi:hypothetical protein
MDLKHIGFEQLLTLVKQLPEEKRETLKAALKTSPKKGKSKASLSSLLLDGPVMTAVQFKTFKANREKFELWRKR